MINLKNENQTIDFGRYISALLKSSIIIALIGDLGSGKTTLSKSIISSLTGETDVPSPTFNIVNEYSFADKVIYHFDFYRLESEDELYAIGFDDYLSNKNAVIIIEWADKFEDMLPKNYIKIVFEKLEDSRNINIINVGKKYIEISDKILSYK
ncbi:MAG: tRNA (adenosine(37)-N6)-threonylcarbamoyltransferase complex ATPase subunit type 1 TsaE [Peptoanaerobacter stomatis]|uniref:tRNA (adenosine(37)-N6)-threonylcarbamoyltransferase complex ATPase subunit type 1 TsaE n=1 Tax=Peptoanaerobacter stomatis TaxID=796937 RepID=UPI003FA16EE4